MKIETAEGLEDLINLLTNAAQCIYTYIDRVYVCMGNERIA